MKFTNDEDRQLFRAVRSSVANESPCLDSSSIHPSELVLNISRGCNLTCSYCFANAGLYVQSASSWMSYKDCREYLSVMFDKYSTIRIIKLFGGEPFMNIPAMTACADFLQEWSEWGGDSVLVQCITNMTIYSERIVDLVERLNLRITASLDGTKELHDENRRYVNGRGSYEHIARNMRFFREAGVSIFAIACVYTPAHMRAGISPLDLHEHFIDEFDVEQVIITTLEDGFGASPAEQLEFSQWVRNSSIDYYTTCVKRRNQHSSYKTVVEGDLRPLFAPSSPYGWCGLGRSTVTVDVDGSVLPCYTLLQDQASWKMGTLEEGSFRPDLQLPDVMRLLTLANPNKADECADCEIRSICSGCPGGTFATSGDFTGFNSVGCASRIGKVEGLLRGWREKG